jgi:GAF domain-containing protein
MPNSEFFHRYLYALADIHESFDLQKTENSVVRHATLLFDGRGASLLLYNPNEENLMVSASFGLSEAYRSKGVVSPSKSLGETIDKTPVIVRDVSTDSRIQFRDAAMSEGIRCIVGLPLAAGSALVGALRIYFGLPRDFSLDEINWLKAYSLQAGLSLKKAFYFASMKAAVSDIQRMPATNSKEALNSLLKSVATYGMAKASALLLIDRKTGTLSNVVRYGLSERYLSKGPIFIGQSLGEAATGQPVIISRAATDPRVQYKEAAAAENVQAIIGLPVKIGDEIAGVLRLYYPFEFEPDSDYIMWMEHLAHQAGIALEKNQLLIKLKERADWYEDVLRDLER